MEKLYQQELGSPVSIFYSYAHADESLRQELEKHLSSLRREGLISEWHDRRILAGADWASTIDDHLNAASVILLLVSPDFIASDYCYGFEMQQALKRHTEGEAYVIPIILRPVDWQSTPFGGLQCLPRDNKPVTSWTNRDEVFEQIAQDIRRIVNILRQQIIVVTSPPDRAIAMKLKRDIAGLSTPT